MLSVSEAVCSQKSSHGLPQHDSPKTEHCERKKARSSGKGEGTGLIEVSKAGRTQEAEKLKHWLKYGDNSGRFWYNLYKPFEVSADNMIFTLGSLLSGNCLLGLSQCVSCKMPASYLSEWKSLTLILTSACVW
jgi:hypothetical protein